MASLTFLGAARTVTGSKYLLDTDAGRILVDCGLFQGRKELRVRNWNGLPVAGDTVDAVVLTHGHLDHIGYLPRLVAHGFRGRVFCTPGTADLCRLILPDSARIQEEDAREANRLGYSRHQPALPLYTTADALRALTQLQPVGYDRPVPVRPGVEVSFTPMGHLLGSAAATLRFAETGRRLVFGGDLGRYDRPVLPDPSPVEEADVLLCESTYGDRLHEPDDGGAHLERVVSETIGRGGKVIIPSFAVGRVEEVLYWIRRLESEQRIPVVPVFLDSPMATEALRYYRSRVDELDPDLRTEGREVAAFMTARFKSIASPQESADLVRSKTPAIVISSSGMATGGRVLHHLERALPDGRNTVLFVGFQAPGTRGHALCNGAPEVKMRGRFIPVNARIDRIEGMSAHADAGEILRWLRGFRRPPGQTFIVHGEPQAMAALQQRIHDELGWKTHAPEQDETVDV